MNYVDPKIVISPKDKVSKLNVLYDGGENGWALAEMEWEGRSVVGIRWNGGNNDPCFPGIGNPQSRGVPTWFVLPDDIADLVVAAVNLGKKMQTP